MRTRSEGAIETLLASDEPFGLIQDTVDVPGEERVIESRKFDEPRVRDVLREVTRVADGDDRAPARPASQLHPPQTRA